MRGWQNVHSVFFCFSQSYETIHALTLNVEFVIDYRFCKMRILCVRENVLKDPFRAQLRKEDVRATEKDKVEMYR